MDSLSVFVCGLVAEFPAKMGLAGYFRINSISNESDPPWHFKKQACRIQNTCSFTLNKLDLNKMLGKPNNMFNLSLCIMGRSTQIQRPENINEKGTTHNGKFNNPEYEHSLSRAVCNQKCNACV